MLSLLGAGNDKNGRRLGNVAAITTSDLLPTHPASTVTPPFLSEPEVEAKRPRPVSVLE